MTVEWDAAQLELKLLPETMALSLMRAATLLTGWEFIRSDIVTGVRDFFLIGFNEDGYLYDDDYQRDVVSMVSDDVSIFDASATWLVRMEALTEEDVALLGEIRRHRNEVAHELAAFLIDPDRQVRVHLLDEARSLIERLGRFWGGIDVDCNPAFDGKEVDYQGIKSGHSLIFDYILSLVAATRLE